MGNSINENNKEGVLVQLSREYEQVRQEPRGVVLLHKATQDSFLLKEYTFGCEILFKNKIKELQEQIDQGVREYVITPVKLESKVFSSFCSTSYKVYAIFEYPQVTLREEITARQKESKNFEEAELWSILQSCTNALSELKPIVSLNPNEIFITPDGHLKIIHDDLVDENYRAVLNEQIYYAPEKMRNFNKLDTELNLRKESVFSMGMTLLEAAQLAEVTPCYNFAQCCFVEDNMQQMLDHLSEIYSPEFLQTLGNILEVNPNRRASLMEVQKILDIYWSSEEGDAPQQEEEVLHSNRSILKESLSSSNKNKVHLIAEQPLKQKNMNSSRRSQKDKPRISEKRRVNQARDCEIMSNYRLQEPTTRRQEAAIPQTPKNPVTLKENHLYTDPKLLEMIKKDLEDINRLKQSAFYETSKYTYMYPQTQSILNSIKNFDRAPDTNRSSLDPQQNFSPLIVEKQDSDRQSRHQRTSELQPTKFMMKKNQSDLVFTVETYENGRRYEGTTLDGMKHGKGKLTFEDGAYYQGEFKEDKMNGKGVLYYSQDSPAYDGEWYNDQFHGYGVLYNEKPQQLQEEFDFRDMNEVEDYWTKYEGEFILDNKAGKGKLYLSNGEVFEGQFSEDSINGQGRFVGIGGQVEGVWEANMLVQVFQCQ